MSKLFHCYFVVRATILRHNCRWLLKNTNKSHVQDSNETVFSESAKSWKYMHLKCLFYYKSNIHSLRKKPSNNIGEKKRKNIPFPQAPYVYNLLSMLKIYASRFWLCLSKLVSNSVLNALTSYHCLHFKRSRAY